MRTLNRPMFNMGGPIKEGVMHGIREPYKGGQLVRPGPGRPGYKGALDWKKKVITKIPGVSNIYQKGLTNIGKLWNQYKFPPRMQATTPTGPGIPYATKARDFMHRAGQYFKQHPYLSTLGPAYLGTTAPVAGVAKGVAGAIPEIAQFGTEVLTPKRWEKYLPPDEWWKWKSDVEWKPGDVRGETPPPDDGLKTIPDVGGKQFLEETTPILTESMKKKLVTTERDRKLNKMLDIMGYDKSKSTAVHRALVDASQILTQTPGGEQLDITKDIISPIIAATGKRLEKPADIREAAGLLMAKGEIEKDIFQSKDTAIEQKINAIKKNLKVDDKTATLMVLGKPTNLREQVTVDAAALKTAPTHRTFINSVKEWYPDAIIWFNEKEAKDNIPKDQKADDYLETKMTEKLTTDPNAKVAGTYIINKELIQVDEAGKTTTLFP